ncbi:cytochrome P450 family protein [Ceratobasidium sp. AG-Ba]|nr:cytochrome P450 family protein [Ceratobasidium sp. AG-Ba]
MTKTLTLMVISSAALGYRLSWIESEEEPWPGYKFSFQKALRIVSESLLAKTLMPEWTANLTETTRSITTAHDEFNRYVHQMVDANRKGSNVMQSASKIESNSTRASGNVLDVLVAASDEDAIAKGKGLTDNEVVGNAFLFLFAGHETTASAVAFALGFLALYPDVQKDVYTQIKQAMGTRSRLEFEDLAKLTLVSGTFLETMRIYPSVSQIFRITSEDTTLSVARSGPDSNGVQRETVFVPAGSQIVGHIAAIHFHPAYWPEPEEFRPSRFCGPYNRDAYLPFSVGGKACIETEGIAALACLLAQYEVSVDTDLFPEIPGESRQARQARLLEPKHYLSVLPRRLPLVFTRRMPEVAPSEGRRTNSHERLHQDIFSAPAGSIILATTTTTTSHIVFVSRALGASTCVDNQPLVIAIELTMKPKHSRPGPVGTSCLTCRRRRKKCGKERPICHRCTVGGFECLGYDIPEEDQCTGKGDPIQALGNVPELATNSSSRPLRPLLPKPTTRPSLLPSSPSTSSSPDSRETISDLCLMTDPNTPESSTISGLEYSVHSGLFGESLEGVGTQDFQESWPSHLLKTHALLDSNSNSVALRLFNNQTRGTDIQALQSWIQPFTYASPQGLSPLPNDAKSAVAFVVSQYERLFDLSFLTPTRQLSSHIRQVLMWGLQKFETTRRTKFLGCKMFECVVDGTSRQKLGLYTRWLEGFERQLKSTSDQILSPINSYNRLAGLLDVAYLKIMFANSANTYQILQETAPIFLQIVFMDFTLWLNYADISSLSLAHVLNSTNYELGRFVLLDALYSMAYGLPQVIEYDTSVPPFVSDIQPVEWVHGCPVELIMALVDINKHFNARICYGPHPDWQPVEHRIKSWRSPVHTPNHEAWKTVAKAAVHESWRHSLLIYLYMAACGVRSDDDRVQSSVRQVFQLIRSVDEFGIPSIDIHFLAQYLIAGVCARSEKQRDTARAKLAATSNDGIWLLRGSDFVPVLDHLWHGAAADGKPIYWSDYVHSREFYLPVPLPNAEFL